MANAINWFEIPASNFDRAVMFYSTVMGIEMPRQEIMGSNMAFFSSDSQGVGGAVCHGEFYQPSSEGSIVYLNGGEDLASPLSRVESAGGQVLMPKTKISDEVGYFALFMDTEGNRMAFHSPR